ncbi:adenosylcobinamide-GDP ribazoletransferase [Marininema halotolerans]|uniref:Adenosylcobinamide-GDP ribazoletransferase n=1 Tax=Marininema halotolerans TaxID=1155944 RepID=A0A1I6RHT4_9BACL|nr:adenosylcobinamide-GDP ribazoletransferase [Marininema halotolerans]SFS64252.1 adenosylcobinamide-GDP ribazoletransferase [Marininema halotolerans]
MNSFLTALSFLTRIPVGVKMERKTWQTSPIWYPAVGMVIGSVLVVLYQMFASIFPPAVTGMLVVTGWVFLTGGLHLDGLMDTADGLGSHRDREEMLAIMKDSRTGAMGVLAAIVVLGLKVVCLASFATGEWVPLIVAPIIGRMALLAGIKCFPYLREKGLGSQLGAGIPQWAWMISLVFGAVVVSAIAGGRGMILLLGAGCFFFFLAYGMVKRLGGLTGDSYGALAEGIETMVLLLGVATTGWGS